MAEWRPPEDPPPERGIDEEGRPYERYYLQFWETPKPWVLGVWVAWYWTLRYWAKGIVGFVTNAAKKG